LTYSTQSGLNIETQGAEDSPDQETENAPNQTQNDESVMECLKVDHTADVYFGEHISSFRQMLKRYSFHSSVLCPATGAGTFKWYIQNWDFPRYRGKWPVPAAIDTPVTGTTNINNAYNTIINYLTPAFVGQRGGIRKKFVYTTDNNSTIAYMAVSRDTADWTAYNSATLTDVFTTPSTFSRNRLAGKPCLYNGGEITYQHAQPVLEVEFPYYSSYRFNAAREMGILAPGTLPPSISQNGHFVLIDATKTANAFVDIYVAAAEDFQLFLFYGAPPMRVIDLSV